MSREYPILCSPLQPCAGINLPAAVLAAPCPGLSPSLRQGSQWNPGLLSAFPQDLEQGWEGGETALARLHTAGSCRERGCSMALPDWQGLSNVSAGTQVGPGVPLAALSPSGLCPAWLCTPKSCGGCSVHVPSVLQCWQHSGAGHWEGTGGSVQDVSCPSPMRTSSGNVGCQALGDPWLCSAPSLAIRTGDGGCVVAGKEAGRSSCYGAGQGPQLPNPGAQSRLGQSSGAVPENNLHIHLQLLCPPGFAHLRQCREMPQSCSLLELSLLCLAGMAPALATCTAPR